ncbi:hypothetical protein CRG98_041222, partial [Punica granatum]
GLRVPGLRVRMYSFRDFGFPDSVSACTALGTLGPRTSCPHVLLQGPSACTPSGTSGPRTSRPHVLLQGLRVPGLRVRMYCFRDFGSPDFVSACTPSGTLRMYSFWDFGSPDFVFACTPSGTLRMDVESSDFACAFTALGTSGSRTSCPH